MTQNAISPAAASELDPYRLPRHVLPVRYEVTLEPDLDAASFRGRAVIAVDVLAPTRLIALNTAELEIQSVHVDGQPATFATDAESERLIIGLIEELPAGRAMIDVSFDGVLNDKLRGFYRSTYRDDHGRERTIACSQMQATDCRRAFPCFDEPDFKAVFSTTLVVDDGLLAISNGPEVGRTSPDERGKIAVRFADTMPMSTYLVAFVVGPLEATAAVDVDGVPLRIVHVPGKGHLTDFGLEVGASSLRWFTNYYGIAYPDAKIDMIALPDFAAGAMENVGCITYRESLLLVDPVTSTQNERELVAAVVSHELAHMWFGDLVTMKWWNGIWLNEAFATFMEVAATAHFRPDWQMWTTFSLDRTAAFEVDSLESTRSVEFEVRSPADCEGMFDVLTYQKGGSLLRMLEQFLGEDRFRAGVRHYLTTHSFKNTETSDLWDSIEIAVANDGGEPVRALMDSWIWQPGYPLVTARSSGDGHSVVFSQQRFSFSPHGPATDQSWLVPVHVRIGSTETKFVLGKESAEIVLDDPSAPVIVNAGGYGFYRVSYSSELLARIDRVTLASMSTIERYTLVDDSWSAVVGGRLSAADFLQFLGSFENETDLAVWQTIVASLRAASRLVDGEALTALRNRVVDLVAPALERLTWSPQAAEDDLRGTLRGLLITTIATLGHHQPSIDRCRDLLGVAQSSPDTVHPDLVAAATTVTAAFGGETEYEDMKKRFLGSTNPQEQLRYLYALAEFPSATLIDRTCEFAMSSNVKTQNAPFLLARCLAHREHGAKVWEFIRRHWDAANAAFPGNSIIRMVDPVRLLNTPQFESDVHAFFAEHPIPQSAKTLDQVLERQRVNVALRSREAAPLSSALRA
ncbi:MAG: hypothetical protein RL391_366 [Actinomycetota bacterium]